MKVIVVEYNPAWINEFEAEATQIRTLLRGIVVNIHHIGSTAVPGLMAKPIIDMIVEVNDLHQLDAKSGKLEGWGYETMGEFGISGRRYFRKGGDNRTHHIHAFKTGDPHIVRHLAFRDYLIEHQQITTAYGALKLAIAKHCQNSGQYCDEKDPFVTQHEKNALAWYEKR